MSKSILVSNRFFQAMRKQAKQAVKKPEYPLNKALEDVAIKNGFNNWHQITIAKQKYDESIIDYQRYPIFFWDIKQGLEMSLGDPWLSDDKALFTCHDLLWEKSRISSCLLNREDEIVGYIYKAQWESFKELYSTVSNVGFIEPEFVYLDGFFFLFKNLFGCSKNKRVFYEFEDSLSACDAIQPALEQLHDGMNSKILNFSSHSIEGYFNQDVIDTVGWSYQQLSDYIIDQRVDEVLLISPPNNEEEDISHIVGKHLVHTVELGF